ncbi:hypothetical protein VTK26DRAFT_575 [Humicola hyalothermophila]
MFAKIVVVVLPLVATYLVTAIWHKRLKQFAHFPQLKPSLIWGHLKALHELRLRGRPDGHIDAVLLNITRELGNPPLILLDLRPVSYPLVVVASHEVAEQISRASKQLPWSTPKSPTLAGLVRVTGKRSILSQQGDEWKRLRKRFNPGFAPQHLMSLLPCILDKTAIFIDKLDEFAGTGKEFPLNKLTINLTFDIIGAITMDVDFDAQHTESSHQGEFIRLYDQLLQLYGVDDDSLPWWMFPRREWRRYRLGAQIDSRLEGMILQKYAEQQQQQQQQQQQRGESRVGSRSILGLSLKGHDTISRELLYETRDQIKTFLFAGHDTTGILLAWMFYELSRTPHALRAVRDELDELFGPDPDPAAVRAKLLAPGGEELIHRMTYTTAVIKETLRLYPPAGTARMTAPGTGFTVQTPEGQSYCLDGMVVYNCDTIIHRERAVFGDSADDFVPERWLGDKSGISAADGQEDSDVKGQIGDGGGGGGGGRKFPAGAWRPFERGPRNCIGQDLAILEARVIVAAVARRYDFVKVGMGEVDLDGKGRPALNEKGQFKVKSDIYNATTGSHAAQHPSVKVTEFSASPHTLSTSAEPADKNSSSIPLGTFQCFPLLPPELRLKIWHMSFLPRTVELHTWPTHYAEDELVFGSTPTWQSLSRNPAALSVNTEAREAALECYTVALPLASPLARDPTFLARARSRGHGRDGGRVLYLNLEQDTVVLLGELHYTRLTRLLQWFRDADTPTLRSRAGTVAVRGKGLRRLAMSVAPWWTEVMGATLKAFARTVFADLEEFALFMYTARTPPESWTGGKCVLEEASPDEDYYRHYVVDKGRQFRVGDGWMVVGRRPMKVAELSFHDGW